MTTAGDHFAELYELAGAQCEGAFLPQQLARLEDLVLADADQRRQYVLYMHVHAQIEEAAQEEGTVGPACRARPSEAEHSASDAASRLFPSLVHPFGTLHPLVGVLLSYTVAAVLLGAGILAAWTRDSRMPATAPRASQAAVASYDNRGKWLIAKVTGLSHCQWADLNKAVTLGADVAAGQVLVLESGLLELTYTSGARATLQGPAIFWVGSYGGMLLQGKVTAETPPVTERPLFCVVARTVVVTERGNCQFGVDVDRAGKSGVYVLRGRVEFRVPEPWDQRPTVLEPRSWASVELGPDHIYRIQTTDLGKAAPEFARGWIRGFPAIAGETKSENAGHKRSPNS
jgi:hypothetical protein